MDLFGKLAEISQMEKKIIGRFDKVDLPQLGIYNIDCKTDTGAYSCAIHTESLEVIEMAGGSFLKAIIGNGNGENTEVTFKNFKQKKVKNSFGTAQVRYLVRTSIRVFERDIETDITLSNRKKLRFPLLLGRKFLKRRFLVDVTLKDLSYTHKLKKLL